MVKFSRKSTRLLMAILLLGVIGLVGGVIHHKFIEWKRFEVVEPGVLYRSGILRDWQLRRALDQYKIKTVFSLTFTNNAAEQRICDEKGVRRYFCYLPGDGVGTDDPYLRFLELVQDPKNHPVLVHCSAGVQRTGGAVALYRVLLDGWEFDDAVAEMIDRGNEGKKPQIDQLRRICRTLPVGSIADRSARRTYK